MNADKQTVGQSVFDWNSQLFIHLLTFLLQFSVDYTAHERRCDLPGRSSVSEDFASAAFISFAQLCRCHNNT